MKLIQIIGWIIVSQFNISSLRKWGLFRTCQFQEKKMAFVHSDLEEDIHIEQLEELVGQESKVPPYRLTSLFGNDMWNLFQFMLSINFFKWQVWYLYVRTMSW